MPSSRPIALVTEPRYVELAPGHWYTDNILADERQVIDALEARGVSHERVAWSDPSVDWSRYAAALLRTPWNYHEHIAEFQAWLGRVSASTTLLNPESIVRWNVDKHYLADLEQRGVHVVPTVFVEPGSTEGLGVLLGQHAIDQAVLKPVVSGAARDTYRIHVDEAQDHDATLARLLREGSVMLQPFQRDIVERGERTLMLIDGRFTHAVRKVPKAGDFRVQDDHGGSVHAYSPTADEIAFAERAIAVCDPTPLYGRVDMIRDNDGRLAVMELELVEPEMWFRLCPAAAEALAEGLVRRLEASAH